MGNPFSLPTAAGGSGRATSPWLRRISRSCLLAAATLLATSQALAAAISAAPAKAVYAPGESITLSYAYRPAKAAKALQVRGGVQGQRPLLDRTFSGWRAGESRTLSFVWTPNAPGTFTLYFEVDPANRMGLRHKVVQRIRVEQAAKGAAGRPTGSALPSAAAPTAPRTVAPRAATPRLSSPAPMTTAPVAPAGGTPNLVVEGVSLRPRSVAEGTQVRLRYRVRNRGNAPAPASNTIIYRAGSAVVTQLTPALAPGAAHSASATVEAHCGASLLIKSDAHNAIQESNESDNSWTSQFECASAPGGGVATTQGTQLAPTVQGPMTQVAPTQGGGQGSSGQSGGQSGTGGSSGCTPDLRVSRVEISPPYPRANQTYHVKIWTLQFLPSGVEPPTSFIAIRRAGHTTAIDSKYVTFAQNNSAVTPDYDWTRSDWVSGPMEVFIGLDNQHRVNECREDNNEFVYPYTVYPENQPMADLAFRGYLNFPSHNLVNQDVNISGQLVNQGNATAGPFWIDFDCDDDRDAHTKLNHRQRVTHSMTAGEVIAFNTHIRWSTPGMKVCIVALDKDREVVESNENNNEYIGVTLHIDVPPPVQ